MLVNSSDVYNRLSETEQNDCSVMARFLTAAQAAKLACEVFKGNKSRDYVKTKMFIGVIHLYKPSFIELHDKIWADDPQDDGTIIPEFTDII